MEEIRYLISDASKKVDVETHVLRYWEEELGLSIPRNEMGHRYYTEFHIHLFRQVKQLKARGYQLKAIRTALQQVMSQNQEFMQAADVLEKDMAQTLQENQSLFRMQNETLPEGIMRLADYNRLENSEYTNSKMGFRKNDVSWDEEIELLDKQDLIFIKEREQTVKKEREQTVRKEKEMISGKDNVKEKTKAAEAEIKDEYKIEKKEKNYNKQKIYNKQEIMEKDGQTEMKKKGKNRKKPSAWERRNGVVGKEQEHIAENSEKKDKPWKSELEELIAERERRMLRERNLRQPDVLSANFGEQTDSSQEYSFDAVQTDVDEYMEGFQIADADYPERISDAEDMQAQAIQQEDKREKGEMEKDNTEKNNMEKYQTEKNNTEKHQTEKDNTEKHQTEKDNTEKNETEKGETGKKETGKTNIEENEIRENKVREIEKNKKRENEKNKTKENEENKTEENKTGKNEHAEAAFMECSALPGPALSSALSPALPQAQEVSAAVISDQEEKMRQFQEIMNHIIGHALEQNNELLSHRISEQVSEQLAGDLEEVIRIRDEREEERFRRLDETIRSCQRDSQGKAEAAAARVPFFKKHRLGRNRHSQSF